MEELVPEEVQGWRDEPLEDAQDSHGLERVGAAKFGLAALGEEVVRSKA